jgi:ferredoxin-type protein NapG
VDENGLSRRQLFRSGINKAVKTGMAGIEHRAKQKSRHWIRPPFARPELDFLLACTRCNACIEVCPHGVIFPLPFSRGAEVAATPALDLLNKGCHLCEDWPCVQACGDGALVLPEMAGEPDSEVAENAESGPDLKQRVFPPILAKVEIDTTTCLPYNGPECGACKGSCPVPGALQWQDEKPSINSAACVGCALCREACIVEPKAVRVSSANAIASPNQ